VAGTVEGSTTEPLKEQRHQREDRKKQQSPETYSNE
jgi:hypothetical protein